tara:strand:+ start:3491 stop:5179 length:1689 start_codon:yes stop_codon:yes gene_type:complete
MHVNIERTFATVARNLGLTDFSSYTNSWVEWAYEAEKLIGSRDTFIQKEASYTPDGNKATGTITFTENAEKGESIIINGVELFFQEVRDMTWNTPAPQSIGRAGAPNEIAIGGTMLTSMDYGYGGSAFRGLIQTLTGREKNTKTIAYSNFEENGVPLSGVSIGTGVDPNAAIFHYPEALGGADYNVTETTSDVEILTNGDFAYNPSSDSSWNLAAGYSWNAAGHIDCNPYLYAHLTQFSPLIIAHKTYRVKFTISNWVSGDLTVYIVANGEYYGSRLVQNMGDGIYSYAISANQPRDLLAGRDGSSLTLDDPTSANSTSWFHSSGSSLRFSRQTSAGVIDCDIDNISLKEITSVELNITAKEEGIMGNNFTIESKVKKATVSANTLTGGKGKYSNQQIILPENNVKLLGVRVGTNATTDKHTEIRRGAGTHRSRVGKDTNDSRQRAFRYYVNGNRLNIQHDSLDEITIVYLAYPVDMRGFPMIKEGHETAVAQYIMWQTKLIEFYNGKLPQYITKELEKRWYFLCGKTRGDDSMPTSEELKQIGNMWNTLLPVKSGNGLINF